VEFDLTLPRVAPAERACGLFDTRLATGEERVIEYRLGAHPRATLLAVEIRVGPDAFNFCRSLLKDGAAGPRRALIAKTLEHSVASLHFVRRTATAPRDISLTGARFP
jgi:hypothetical protein